MRWLREFLCVSIFILSSHESRHRNVAGRRLAHHYFDIINESESGWALDVATQNLPSPEVFYEFIDVSILDFNPYDFENGGVKIHQFWISQSTF